MAVNPTLPLPAAPSRVADTAPAPPGKPAAPATGTPRAPGSAESFSRVEGEGRQRLDMGGAQPTHHAMLVPKSQFQTPKAANDNQRNFATPEEKAAGIHVDEFGWVTLPPGSTITIPPKS